jgi:hypothetical protein
MQVYHESAAAVSIDAVYVYFVQESNTRLAWHSVTARGRLKYARMTKSATATIRELRAQHRQ